MFQSIHDWMAFDQEQVTLPSDMDRVPETGGCWVFKKGEMGL